MTSPARAPEEADGTALDPMASGVPERVAHYRIVAPLGSGGTSDVYAAVRDDGHALPTWVAIKLLAARRSHDSVAAASFAREASLVARIAHPALLPVLDAGIEGDRPWIATQLVLGESVQAWSAHVALHDEPRSVAPPPLMIAQLVASAAEGLHAAHEVRDEDDRPLGVVHRDVTPANLLVGFDGCIRVIDFGIARADLAGSAPTAHGELKGTIGYLAPEYLGGDPIDRRADVWSLGVTTWEWITGRRLFPARTLAELLPQVRSRGAHPMRDHVPGVPLGLEEAIAKAIATDPERRHASARALAEDLLGCIAEEGVALGPSDVVAWMERVAPGLAARQSRVLARARKARVSLTSGAAGAGVAAQGTAPRPTRAAALGFGCGFGAGLALGVAAGRVI